MKYLMLLFLTIFHVIGQAQNKTNTAIDTTLAKKISISGYCLCQTNLDELKEIAPDLSKVTVEEMDISKECTGQDSRFVNGKGYSSSHIPGMIFQKEKSNSNLISKIRLTKSFKGKLPNDSLVNLKNLKLKDILKKYPKIKGKWLSRGCSKYWRFSNDTISFYVKIDKSIQPQFPIHKDYYLDKPVEAIDLVISCYSIYNKSPKISLFNPNDPLFYLDSIRVNKSTLTLYDANEIAFITVFKNDKALRIAGDKGKNGVVFIYTKGYVKQKYWEFLKSKSTKYAQLIPDYNKDNTVVYILNNKVLSQNDKAELFELNDKNFIELKIINAKKLKRIFKVKNKEWGIVIKALKE